jgi:hypothetical protein
MTVGVTRKILVFSGDSIGNGWESPGNSSEACARPCPLRPGRPLLARAQKGVHGAVEAMSKKEFRMSCSAPQ